MKSQIFLYIQKQQGDSTDHRSSCPSRKKKKVLNLMKSIEEERQQDTDQTAKNKERSKALTLVLS